MLKRFAICTPHIHHTITSLQFTREIENVDNALQWLIYITDNETYEKRPRTLKHIQEIVHYGLTREMELSKEGRDSGTTTIAIMIAQYYLFYLFRTSANTVVGRLSVKRNSVMA